MRSLLDTSVIVRYLTGDPPVGAVRATDIVDSSAELILPDVVLAETAHVLMRYYRVARASVVDTLIELIQRENIKCLERDKGRIVQALLLCRASGRVSFVDALTWAAAHSSGVRAVHSFDERFPADGIEVRR